MNDNLGFGEMQGGWYNLLLPQRLESDESESEGSELESEVSESEASDSKSQSEQTTLRCGDLVLFLNSVDEKLSRKQESQQLLFVALFLICYQRNLFPRDSFKDIYMPSLGMRIKELIPAEDSTSVPFICFLKGVYAAVEKNYARELWLRVTNAKGVLEEYTFVFDFMEEEAPAEQRFRSLASNMIRTIENLLWGFEEFPTDCNVLVSLFLNAPADYEPSWFQGWEHSRGDFYDFEEENARIQHHQETSIVIERRYPVRITLQVRTVMDSLDKTSSSTDDEKYAISHLQI